MLYQKERLLKELTDVQKESDEYIAEKEQAGEDITKEIDDMRTIIKWFIQGVSNDAIRNYEYVAEKIDAIKRIISKK